MVLKTVLGGEVVFERTVTPSLRVFGEIIPTAVLEGGTTWVPAVDFANALGMNTEIINGGNSVTITRGGVTVELNVGGSIGNETVRPGVVVPARALADALGLVTSWHPHGLAANITPW
jgi:hypothetical protein